MKNALTWIFILCFTTTSNYGLAQNKTTKTSDALELREGYKNIILSRTDPDSHFSYYTRIAIPEEVVGKESALLRQISTKASQELSGAKAESGTYPIGLKVFTKTIPAELGQEYLQKIQKQTPFGLKSKGEVKIENTYCSLLKDYDKTQTIDTKKGLPVVCKELDELALIKELIPPSYALVSNMWNPANINTFNYILPEGMENFNKRNSKELADAFTDSMKYTNSRMTRYDLFKRVNTNALKISISTLLSAFEYIGDIKVNGKNLNPLKCSPSSTRSDCLYKYLKATYADKLNEYFLWEIVQFHMENVPLPKTTFKQDMDKDIDEFNKAVAEINYDTNNARDFLWNTPTSGSTYYTSPEIRKELIKNLLATRYGRLFVAKAFSEFIGPLDFSRQLNQLSKYNLLKGESILTASLSELMTTTSTAINDLINDRTKYWFDDYTAKKKITLTVYSKLFDVLTEYMKTYPFAFRQYMKTDPSAIAPRSREFMVSIRILHNVLRQEQGKAVKDYVINGGAAILGLALMCTGVGAPYGLVIAGYASSAIIIANTMINVDDALKEKSYAQKGGATGAQNVQESYEKIKQQSERITNDLINGGGEAFGLALVASVAGGAKVIKMVSGAKATKYATAVTEIVNGSKLTNTDAFATFMGNGTKRMSEITNEKVLAHLARNPDQLTYVQAKLASLDNVEAGKFIQSMNLTENPETTINNIRKVDEMMGTTFPNTKGVEIKETDVATQTLKDDQWVKEAKQGLHNDTWSGKQYYEAEQKSKTLNLSQGDEGKKATQELLNAEKPVAVNPSEKIETNIKNLKVTPYNGISVSEAELARIPKANRGVNISRLGDGKSGEVFRYTQPSGEICDIKLYKSVTIDAHTSLDADTKLLNSLETIIKNEKLENKIGVVHYKHVKEVDERVLNKFFNTQNLSPEQIEYMTVVVPPVQGTTLDGFILSFSNIQQQQSIVKYMDDIFVRMSHSDLFKMSELTGFNPGNTKSTWFGGKLYNCPNPNSDYSILLTPKNIIVDDSKKMWVIDPS